MIHLDTSFLIRALVRGTPEDRVLRSWIKSGTPLAICAVGWAELLCGPLEESELALVGRIVGDVAPLDAEATTWRPSSSTAPAGAAAPSRTAWSPPRP